MLGTDQHCLEFHARILRRLNFRQLAQLLWNRDVRLRSYLVRASLES